MNSQISAGTLGSVFLSAILGFVLLVVGNASASDSVKDAKNRSLAIRGYDAVAYQRQGKAVAGKARFEHRWSGARWQFVSEENRDRFAAEPERFAPQYGGYCAWGVAQGAQSNVDPRAFVVRDGKLYLFHSESFKKIWEEKADAHIARADLAWPTDTAEANS